MPDLDYNTKVERNIETNYWRNKLIAFDASYANDTTYLYGDKAEFEYKRLTVNGAIKESGSVNYSGTGDGVVDETALILAAANFAVSVGKPLSLDGTKRYVVANLVLPATLRLITNGATFVKKVNNNTYAVRTPDNFHCDSLKLEVTGGASNEAGVYVGGSDTVIDNVNIVSLTADQPGANALFVGDILPANKRTNVRINRIGITGFRSPMRVCNVDKGRFLNGTITNFLTGVYVVDNSDTKYENFVITGTSPSSTGSAGQNGFLMEAQSADLACSNVQFINCLVDGSPEHAYRIGGSLTCKDITFQNCVAKNAGNAPGNVATGGGAFKCLGVVGHFHKNIRYVNCSAEDSNTNGNGINNFNQFAFGFVDGLTLINPTVRAVNKTYSAQIAMYISASKNIQVINPDFRDTKTFAVFLGRDGTDSSGEGVTEFKMSGGFIHSANTHAFSMSPDTITLKNIYLDNVTIIGNTVAARGMRCEPIGTGGAYVNNIYAVNYELNMTAGTEPPLITPAAGVMLRYHGPLYGYTMSADNGSTMVDTTNGAFKIRKAGAWVAL